MLINRYELQPIKKNNNNKPLAKRVIVYPYIFPHAYKGATVRNVKRGEPEVYVYVCVCVCVCVSNNIVSSEGTRFVGII